MPVPELIQRVNKTVKPAVARPEMVSLCHRAWRRLAWCLHVGRVWCLWARPGAAIECGAQGRAADTPGAPHASTAPIRCGFSSTSKRRTTS